MHDEQLKCAESNNKELQQLYEEWNELVVQHHQRQLAINDQHHQRQLALHNEEVKCAERKKEIIQSFHAEAIERIHGNQQQDEEELLAAIP